MSAKDLPAAGSGGAASAQAGSDNLVFFNGIDAETGEYAIKPQTVDDLAKLARANPRIAPMQISARRLGDEVIRAAAGGGL